MRNQKTKMGERQEARTKKKDDVLSRTFGTLKFSKPIEQLMKEIDKELDSEF